MLTVRQLFDDMMLLLGQEDPDLSSAPLRARVLADIQAALQLMQACGEDYYGRQEDTVTLAVGTGVYVLDTDVQTILEPVRIGTQPLHRLENRAQLEDFGPLFLGQTSRTVANGTPIAFFVESLAQDDAEELPDAVKVRLHVAPPPSAIGTLTFNCIKEPPLYTGDDLCDEESIPPVPHKYHESILRPLCRMNITTCSHFKRHRDMLPQIEADYTRALNLLGIADPRRPKPANSNSAAAQMPATAAQ